MFGEAGVAQIGEEKIHMSQRAGTFQRNGANVTLSSDVTSMSELHRANPFIGLEMSVTRKEYGQLEHKGMGPASERLTLTNAIMAYTYNAAKQLGLESKIGSLSAGKNADFVVLQQNPFEMDVYTLHKLQPTAVVIDGTIVSGSFDL